MKDIDPKELEYLGTVRDFIDKEILKLKNLSQELEDKIMAEGKKFSMDDPFLSVYGGPALTDLHYSIERKIQRSENAKQEAYFLGKLKSHPYFARVDFKEEDWPSESFYIGIKSLFEEKEISPYVYDWRAPVASLFYEEFDDGKAWYDAPSGRIEGELEKKRQYKFENGELVYCFDSDMKIDDFILQQALSESSTDRLKVIVGSIQKEQNRAIRFGYDKNLVICGPAGSGKTSVGFHRLAYMLYRHRENLSSAQIVMLTGSDIFASYVSDIIPELGEAPIKDMNIYSLLSEIPGENRLLDYYEQAEAIMCGDSGRAEKIKIKYSAEAEEFIKNYTEKMSYSVSDFSLYGDIVYKGSALSGYLKRRNSLPFPELLAAAITYAEEKIDAYFSENYEKIYEIADKQSSILDNTGEYIESMKKEIKLDVRKKLETELDTDDKLTLLNIYKEYEKKVLKKDVLSSGFNSDLENGVLKFEDALLILYIRCLLGKVKKFNDVRHVLIDEAQDCPALQHKIIKSLYPRATFTILTDPKQAIVPLINTPSLDEICGIYSAELLELKKSYRSTKQISLFAKGLLSSPDYETFDRSGDEVLIKESDDIIKLIKEEKEKADGSFCVITKTSAEARHIYNELIKDTDIEIYDDKDKFFSDKAAILPVVYSKGLEFDNVLIINSKGGGFAGEENKPYLYMAATRALHSLKIINTK